MVKCRRHKTRLLSRTRRRRRGTTSLEFALIAIPCLTLVLFIMELAYDLFTQEVLDASLHVAARQIQTGNAQNVKSGSDFVARFLGPAMNNLLAPSNVYVRVQKITPQNGQDYYDFTTGALPMNAGSLDLSAFNSGSFCNSGPTQLLLISAIYVGPAIVAGLLPNVMSVSYNGGPVHATLSTVGIVSEAYPQSAVAAGSAASC